MHAQHPHRQGIVLIESPFAHEGGGHRDPIGVGQLGNFGVGTGDDRPTSHIQQGPLGLQDQLGRCVDLPWVATHGGLVAGDVDLADGLIVKLFQAHIFGDVDQHRPGPTCSGNVKSLRHDPRHLARIPYHVGVLHNGQGDAKDVRLLEAVGANQMARYLPSDDHHGYRVHHGVGDARHQVGRPWARGSKTHPHLASGASISVGGVGSRLFVAYQVMFEQPLRLGFVQLVVDGEDGSPRIAKDVLHPMPVQAVHQRISTSRHDVSSPLR